MSQIYLNVICSNLKIHVNQWIPSAHLGYCSLYQSYLFRNCLPFQQSLTNSSVPFFSTLLLLDAAGNIPIWEINCHHYISQQKHQRRKPNPNFPLIHHFCLHPHLSRLMLQVILILNHMEWPHTRVPENQQWRKLNMHLLPVRHFCVRHLFSQLMLQVMSSFQKADWCHNSHCPKTLEKKTYRDFSPVHQLIEHLSFYQFML